MRARFLGHDRMYQDKSAWIEHQRRRWLRPNAYHFIRPDVFRFMPPAAPRLTGKDVVRYFRPDVAHDQRVQAPVHKHDLDFSAVRDSLLQLEREVTALRAELKFRRFFQDLKAGFNPDQARDDHGRWTDGSRAQYAQARVPGLGRADGHHYVPHGVYDKLPLSPDTRKVFDDAKTGRLSDSRSNKYDTSHRLYNDAVKELFDEFIKRNQIQLEQMTPDQARQFLGEVLGSRNPRIRNFNMNILLREIMRRLPRWPRGNQ
jgi:hypothetical protein